MNENSHTDKDKGMVQGDGFVMEGKPYHQRRSTEEDLGVKLRTGASNEEVIKKRQEELEKEAAMTPEEKAKRDRDTFAQILENSTMHGREFSETIFVQANGQLDPIKRLGDKNPPAAVTFGGLNGSEDLYKFMQKISQEHPQLNISFEVDPNRNWIRYRVTQKSESDR